MVPVTLLMSLLAAAQPIVTWEDTAATGRPVTNASVAGIHLGTRILSGSRFTLHPDRLSTWEYDMGFRAIPHAWYDLDRREATERADAVYPFNKRLHDPLQAGRHQVRVIRPHMQLGLSRNRPELVYPLDFGRDFAAVGLLWRPWEALEDGTGPAGSAAWEGPDSDGRFALRLRVTTDAAGEHIVAERTWDLDALSAMRQRGSLYLTLPALRGAFHARLTLVQGKLGYFCGGSLKAWLRYTGKAPWPVPSGAKAVPPHERPDNGAVTVAAVPPDALLLPRWTNHFAGLTRSGANCTVETVRAAACVDRLMNDAGLLRLSGAPAGGNWSLTIGFPAAVAAWDWTDIKAIRVHYRVPTWLGRVQITGRMPASVSFGAAPLIPQAYAPVDHWEVNEKPLPLTWTPRKPLNGLVLSSWGPTWQVDPDDEKRPWTVEIGAIELVPYVPGEREAALDELREREAWKARGADNTLVRRLDALPLPSGPRVNPRDHLLRGFWGAPIGNDFFARRVRLGAAHHWEAVQWMIDDWKAHHLNAMHFEVSNLRGPDLERWVKLAADNDIKLWGCYSFLSRMPGVTTAMDQRWKWWNRSMTGEWAPIVDKYRQCPAILAWAPGEEPAAWQLPFLADFRRVTAERGGQPQIMIHNKLDVMQADAAVEPFPGGAAFDTYVFRTLPVPLSRYLDGVAAIWSSVKQSGGVGWVTPQMVGMQSGHDPSFLDLSRADMRFQVWSALAYNIKGFFPWMYLNGALTPEMGETTFYGYYGDEMGRIARLEKLIVAMERDDDLALLAPPGEHWLMGSFADRGDPGHTFVILVNLDLKRDRPVTLEPLAANRAIARIGAGADGLVVERVAPDTPIVIEPGDGQIFYVGDASRLAGLAARYAHP